MLPLLAHDGHSFDSCPIGVAVGFGPDAIPTRFSSWLPLFVLTLVTPLTPCYPNGIAAVFGPDAMPTTGIVQIIALIGVLEFTSCKALRESEKSLSVTSLLMDTLMRLGHIQ